MKEIMLVKIKIIICLVVITASFNIPVFAQVKDATVKKITLSAEQAKMLYENEKKIKEWLDELKKPGVTLNPSSDQMTFNKEALRLIDDPSYRNEVYKDVYTYDDVKVSLANGKYIKAIWQLITIYPENKEHVVKYIYAFDKVIPSDKLVVNAFYTYAFFDPKITTIENGKPNIYRPDIFEEYLRRTKEIVAYVAYFRNEEPEKVKN